MTLLITTFAAITTTAIWYFNENSKVLKLGTLSLMYWGAAIMWFVDAIFEYVELQAAYFVQDPMDMLNDAFLGLCVVALGLIIWLVVLLSKDPKGVLHKRLVQ